VLNNLGKNKVKLKKKINPKSTQSTRLACDPYHPLIPSLSPPSFVHQVRKKPPKLDTPSHTLSILIISTHLSVSLCSSFAISIITVLTIIHFFHYQHSTSCPSALHATKIDDWEWKWFGHKSKATPFGQGNSGSRFSFKFLGFNLWVFISLIWILGIYSSFLFEFQIVDLF